MNNHTLLSRWGYGGEQPFYRKHERLGLMRKRSRKYEYNGLTHHARSYRYNVHVHASHALIEYLCLLPNGPVCCRLFHFRLTLLRTRAHLWIDINVNEWVSGLCSHSFILFLLLCLLRDCVVGTHCHCHVLSVAIVVVCRSSNIVLEYPSKCRRTFYIKCVNLVAI